MKYNLLTINNITKLCNTQIYVFDEEPIPMQWYNFQLNWLIKKINIVSEPLSLLAQRITLLNKSSETDLSTYNNLTNTDIFNIFKKKFRNNYKCETINGLIYHHIDIPKESYNTIDDAELIKYGFYSSARVTSNDIKNEGYFGGFSNFTTSLSDNNTEIVVKLRDDEDLLYSSEKPEVYSANFPFPNTLVNISSKDTDTHAPKKQNESVVIQDKIGKTCTKGVFRWKDNSCYADSILMMLFRRIYNNSNGLLSNIINTPILFNEHTISPDMCSTDGNRVENINNILTELNKLLQQINDNKILYIKEFLNIMDKCKKKKKKFSDKETQSPSVFLGKLINIIYNDKLSDLNQYKVHNTIMDRVVTIIKNTDEIYWSEHEEKLEKLSKIETDDASQIQIIEHQFSDIKQKLETSELYKDELDEVILKPSESIDIDINKKISDIYGYNVKSMNAEHFLHKIETSGISVEKFFHQINILKTTNDGESVEYFDSGNNTFLIEESIITEKASDIFLFINRSSSIDINNLASINRLKIYPEEKININGVSFELSGIIYMPHDNHFGCLFKCNNAYYTYDDLHTDEWLNSIGTIEDVVSNSHICNTSSIYYYTKVIS